MGSSLRYWINPKGVIDLEDVSAIIETGWGGIAGYSYQVAIKKVDQSHTLRERYANRVRQYVCHRLKPGLYRFQ